MAVIGSQCQPVSSTRQSLGTAQASRSPAASNAAAARCRRVGRGLSSSAAVPQTAGQNRYIKVVGSAISVERRINRYAAMPGSQPSQNSRRRRGRWSASRRSHQNVQPPASANAGHM